MRILSWTAKCHFVNFMKSSPKLNAPGSHFGDFHAVRNAFTVAGATLANSVVAVQRCEVH